MKVQSLQNGSATGEFPTTPDLPSVIVQSADRPWKAYVLEGGLIDHEGELTAGGYAARPAGGRHVAKASAAGCLNISFFLRPNLFFDDEGGVKAFER